LPFKVDDYSFLSISPLQVNLMDALDLLADFAGLVSCSSAKVNPIDAKIKYENIASSVPKLSATQHESLQSAPEQLLGVVPNGNWTAQPQNPQSTTVSQQAFLNQPSEVYNCIWNGRGDLENCEPHWNDGRHFDQYMTEQPGIKGPHECFDYRYAPPWTSMYAFESNVPALKDSRPPHQYARGLHGTYGPVPLALPDYRPFGSRCINDGCDCQAYDLRFTNTVNGYMSTPMDEQRNEGAVFRNNQVEKTYDPWMAMTMNEEQLRFSQGQHH
jgi:hypothetical protein